MSNNSILSNNSAGTNPDIPVRDTEITSGVNVGKKIQHMRIDVGAGGAESVVSAANPLPVTPAGGSVAAVVTNAGTFAVQDTQVLTDNGPFVDGTSKVFMSGHVFDNTAGTALTENDAAASRIDSKRAQMMVIEDGTTRARVATVTAAGNLRVDGSTVTQPITQTDPSLLSARVEGTSRKSTPTSQYAISTGGAAWDSPTAEAAYINAGNLQEGALDPYGRVYVTSDPNSLLEVIVSTGFVVASVTGTVSVSNIQGATSTQTSVAGSASSQTLLASNSSRKRYTIFNDSTAILYVRESSSAASSTTFTYKLYPEGSVSVTDYTGAITGIWASATGNARISQVT